RDSPARRRHRALWTTRWAPAFQSVGTVRVRIGATYRRLSPAGSLGLVSRLGRVRGWRVVSGLGLVGGFGVGRGFRGARLGVAGLRIARLGVAGLRVGRRLTVAAGFRRVRRLALLRLLGLKRLALSRSQHRRPV